MGVGDVNVAIWSLWNHVMGATITRASFDVSDEDRAVAQAQLAQLSGRHPIIERTRLLLDDDWTARSGAGSGSCWMGWRGGVREDGETCPRGGLRRFVRAHRYTVRQQKHSSRQRMGEPLARVMPRQRGAVEEIRVTRGEIIPTDFGRRRAALMISVMKATVIVS